MPSDSTRARAEESCLRVKMRTERFCSCSGAPSRLEPEVSSDSATGESADQMQGLEDGSAALPASQSECGPASFCGIFVKLDEVAQRHRKARILTGAEGVRSERILKPCDDNRKTERVQSRVHEDEVIGQGRKFAVLLAGNLLKLGQDRGPGAHRHCKTSKTKWLLFLRG